MTYENTQVTLEQLVESWLKGKELSRRPHTVLQYRQIIQQHILPHLGKMRLQDIQPAHVKQLYFKKRGEGRGDRTVKLIHTVLNNVLMQAAREGLMGHNPVDAVEWPNVEQTEHPILSEEQALKIIIASMSARNGTLYYLALITGMREGELLCLKWSDLDRGKGLLFIHRQRQRAPRIMGYRSPRVGYSDRMRKSSSVIGIRLEAARPIKRQRFEMAKPYNDSIQQIACNEDMCIAYVRQFCDLDETSESRCARRPCAVHEPDEFIGEAIVYPFVHGQFKVGSRA